MKPSNPSRAASASKSAGGPASASSASKSSSSSAASSSNSPASMNVSETGFAGGGKSLYDLTAGSGFSHLRAAIQAAGLKETLSHAGPFTLFAPTDEAFAKLPKGTLDNFFKPENKSQLISLINNHLLSGKVLAKEITQGRKERMASGRSAPLTQYGEAGKLSDTLCANGVLHPIDHVVLPN